METFLQIDNGKKQLALAFKKRYETDNDIRLKLNGLLNTVTAAGTFQAELQKFFRVGKPAVYSPTDPYQPDTRLRLGLGAKAASPSDDILLSASVRKRVVLSRRIDELRTRSVLRGYTQLTAGAHYDYNLRSEKWNGEAEASLSHAVFRFSDNQDLRLTAGVRLPLEQKGAAVGLGEAKPFLTVQENCWGLHSDLKGNWRVTYDL